MSNDITSLRDFYQSAMGQMAQRVIAKKIRETWPNMRGLRLMGLGFAISFLEIFIEETTMIAAIMPAAQGAMPWPENRPGMACLADETNLPLPDRSIDRAIVIHTFRSTEHARFCLREIWRVLIDDGRLLVISPNICGLWGMMGQTPFGHEKSYTKRQLHNLLQEALYQPLQSSHLLFVPPILPEFLTDSASVWEKIGNNYFPALSGLVMIEATKRIYAAGTVHGMAGKTGHYQIIPQGNF